MTHTPRGAGRFPAPPRRYPHLLVAAAPESAGIAVLHYDRDFEAIGEVRGQAMRWIAEPGSIRAGAAAVRTAPYPETL